MFERNSWQNIFTEYPFMLHNRVELESGNRYRLTSTERSGSGDPWYDKAQRGREQVSLLRLFLLSHFETNT